MTAVHDKQWFEPVFPEHGKAIVKLLYRRGIYAKAEDLAAKTFVVLRYRRGEVPDGAELPWLYETAGLTLSS